MSADILTLEPVTRSLCHALLSAWEAAMHPPVRLTHTLRSMDEQLHLWAMGRALVNGVWVVVSPRKVVTKVPPGSSAHNYGAAFDLCFNGTDPYLHAYEVENHVPDPLWEALGVMGEGFGLVWGGRWKRLQDRPHFERADWKSLRTQVVA